MNELKDSVVDAKGRPLNIQPWVDNNLFENESAPFDMERETKLNLMSTIFNEGGGGDDEQNVVQLKKTLSNNELPNVDEVVLENKDTHKISNAEYMLNDDGILQHKNTKKHKKEEDDRKYVSWRGPFILSAVAIVSGCSGPKFSVLTSKAAE